MVTADRVHKELNFFVVLHADLSPGGCITQITLLIWGMEFLPGSLSDVCATRELLEEAGMAVPPCGSVALSSFVSLGVEQPFSELGACFAFHS